MESLHRAAGYWLFIGCLMIAIGSLTTFDSSPFEMCAFFIGGGCGLVLAAALGISAGKIGIEIGLMLSYVLLMPSVIAVIQGKGALVYDFVLLGVGIYWGHEALHDLSKRQKNA